MRQLKITQSITRRDSKSLDCYFREISNYPLLTAEEEAILAGKIRQGDRRALDRLVQCNLRFVVSVAKQFENKGLDLVDLINEGNLGLIKAARKFDETRGFKFISFAVWWIRQSISKAVDENGYAVRLPLNQADRLRKINKEQNRFEQEHMRRATHAELADMLDLSEDRISDTLTATAHARSLDAPYGDDEDGCMADNLAHPDAPSADATLMAQDLVAAVAYAIASLPERDGLILRMYFGIDHVVMTIEEISHEFNITRERVRQLKDKAIRTLRNRQSESLRVYLGA